MIDFKDVKIKYAGFLMFTILVCTCFLTFGDYWMPVKTTQSILLENPVYSHGIMEAFLEVEKHIQVGDYLLVDNIPKRVWTENAEISVIKMVDEKKVLPNTKYRIEMKFKHPETVISRTIKLDAIVVNVNHQQNHDFADLFWSLE
jgi:hypothetical protein